MALLKFQLTDLTTNIDLVYDVNNQTKYRLMSAKTDIDLPDMVYHKPDDSEPIPIRGIDGDRTFHFVLDVKGNTQDEVEQRINLLKRWVDGANSQALRYWSDGDVLPIYLAVKKPYAANSTLAKVKFGAVNDGEGQYTNVGMINNEAYSVSIRLVVEPYSIARRPIVLHNDLPSSPHAIEDSTAGNLPDGWSFVNSPTVTQDTDHYLIGHKSVRVTTATTGLQGLQSPIATTVAGDEVTAYAWVKHSSGDPLTIALRGTLVTIMSKTLTYDDIYNVADRSVTDYLGESWYRVPLQGIAVDTVTRVRVSRESAVATQATTFWVDSFYLQANPDENEFDNPVMTLDTDGDGTADDLTYTGSRGATMSIDSTNYVTGGESQKVSCDNFSTQGLTTSFTMSATHRFSACVLLAVSGDPVTVTMRDSTYGKTYAEKKVTATDTYAVGDWKTDGSGSVTPVTFYRVSGQGIATNGGTLVIDIVRKGADATQTTNFWIDSILVVYDVLDTDTIPLYALAPPDGFCSTSETLNNYAPTASSENRINYIDVWGLPGDEDALTLLDWQTTSSNAPKTLLVSRTIDLFRRYLATERAHWFQQDQTGWSAAETTTNGSWSTVTNASLYSGTTARRFTASGGTGSGARTLTITGSRDVDLFFSGMRHVYLLAFASDTGAEIRFQAYAGYASQTVDLIDTGWLSLPVSSFPEVIDGGILNDSPIFRQLDGDKLIDLFSTVTVKFSIQGVGNGDTVTIDAVFLQHDDTENIIVELIGSLSVTETIYFNGRSQDVLTDIGGVREPGVLGSMWKTQPGVNNRYVFMSTDSAYTYYVGDGSIITITCYPRTSHLLGVI